MEIAIDGKRDFISESDDAETERVEKQQNNDNYNIQLSNEVLGERQKVWDNFFRKYNNEVPNAVELDIDELAPIESPLNGADAEEEEEEEEEGEEEEEAEEVDVEEAADDLEAEEDSEKEYYTKCRAPLRKLPVSIQYWIDTGNPPYQLLDVDNNSETGSSLSEGDNSDVVNSAIFRDSIDTEKKSSHYSSVDTAAYILSNGNTTKKSEALAIVAKSLSDKSTSLRKNIDDLSKTSNNRNDETITKNNETTKILSTPVKNNLARKSDFSSPGQQSVKLSLILPEIKEFDDMIERSKISYKTRLSLERENRKNSKIFGDGPNRRRLYTGRDSPVDLIQTIRNDDNHRFSQTILHPALEIDSNYELNIDKKISRAKRKRKRSRKISNDFSTRESDEDLEKSQSYSRYKDFFESLGLTPSRMIDSKSNRRNSKRKILPRNAKKIETSKNLRKNSKDSTETSKNHPKIDKICRIDIVKLSDSIVDKYRRKDNEKIDEIEEIDDYSSDFKNESNESKIELLNSVTHDSDSSTILICSCDKIINNKNLQNDFSTIPNFDCTKNYDISFFSDDEDKNSDKFTEIRSIDTKIHQSSDKKSVITKSPKESIEKSTDKKNFEKIDKSDESNSEKSVNKSRKIVRRSKRQKSSSKLKNIEKSKISVKNLDKIESNEKTRNIFDDTDSPQASITLFLDDAKNDETIKLKFIEKKSSKQEKKILRNSKNFRTRLNEDSDAEFDDLFFSLNTQFIDDKIRNSDGKTRKTSQNLFAEKSKKLKNDNFEDFWNNNNNEKNSLLELKKTKNLIDVQKKNNERKIRKFRDLRNFEKSDKVFSINDKRNGEKVKINETPQSKNVEYRRIAVNKNIFKDDTDSSEDKINLTNAKRKTNNSIKSDDHLKRMKLSNFDSEHSRKSREFGRRIFAKSPDDEIDDVDLLFGKISQSSNENNVINGLNFTTRKYKNCSVYDLRTSFRTKLISDAEDDEDY